MLIMQDETFGPVIPVVIYGDVEEAVALANDSAFGLSAAVFSADADAAKAVAERLQVGAISINDASLTGIVNDVGKKQLSVFRHGRVAHGARRTHAVFAQARLAHSDR
jgi:aldehyde dehydrogenase (NAD+)